jgi:two-component system, OmpR family, phosphate regulon sensor histidine kinase PhoR
MMPATRDGLLDALGEAVVWLEAGVVKRLNRAAEELFVTSSERAAGRAPIEILRNFRLEQIALSSGEIELELNGKILRARGVPGGLVLEDITQQRKRESELREVVAVLSHEFRTPVAAVKSLLEAIALEPPQEQRERFVELSLQEVERLVRLVEDLTVGFRPQAERTFPMLEAFERVERLTAEEFARRAVTLKPNLNGAIVRCDPDKLVQVFLNLVENAARHGPNPGVVRVSSQTENGFVRVTVRDEGRALEDYERIFDAHRRGPQSRGSGMGLYVVRSIVHAWGGRVSGHFESDGGGNEFSFTVPTA